MEPWKYALAGFVSTVFWALVMRLTRRYCPRLLMPVGVAFRRLLRRRIT